MAEYADTEAATTRRQALVTVDKVREALEDENDGEAKQATKRLAERVGELLEADDGE